MTSESINPAPGRPREFDVDEALDSAVGLFWEKGFRATTTRDLEGHLGISQSSLYRAFGSKDDLLQSVIDRYEAGIAGKLLGVLRRDGDGWSVLSDFIEALREWTTDADGKGCLVINLMTADSDSDAIRARVEAYRLNIWSALRDALARTETPKADLDRRASVLLAAVVGVHVTARSSAPGSAEVANMIEGLCALIDQWRLG